MSHDGVCCWAERSYSPFCIAPFCHTCLLACLLASSSTPARQKHCHHHVSSPIWAVPDMPGHVACLLAYLRSFSPLSPCRTRWRSTQPMWLPCMRTPLSRRPSMGQPLASPPMTGWSRWVNEATMKAGTCTCFLELHHMSGSRWWLQTLYGPPSPHPS